MSDEPTEPFGATSLLEMRARRMQSAKASYSQILDKLWISNGAGAAAVFTRAGDLIKGTHSSSHQYLGPLGFFIAGAILPILGNASALVVETIRLREIESANSVLDLQVNHAKRPTAQAGLRLWDARTLSAIFSALALTIGGMWGFYLLACS